jgi:hypothetical protein
MPRVTTRQEPSETGLARVTQTPRGFIVSVDGERVGRVGASWQSLTNRVPVWHWYATVGGVSFNSAGAGMRYDSREDAKIACLAWVRVQLRVLHDPRTPQSQPNDSATSREASR